jgi:cell wall-associated NlpC family hydrolase
VKLIALLLPLLLVACASAPESVAYSTVSPKGSADRAAASAQKMVGKPYKYGGVILFSYRQAGVSLPHNTEQQRRVAQRVKLAELKRGDLLFFDQEGKKHSHVGIYLGERRFVHAPSSGKHVRNDSLDSPYWKKHLSEVRRLAT